MQTDCGNPPISWVDAQKSFWKNGYVIVTPCAYADHSGLLNAVHDYTLDGCKWALAARQGKNYPRPGPGGEFCPRKTNRWKTVAAIHDAAVHEETRKMIAHLHGTDELPFPYQTVTRVAPAIIKPHSDVVFWDTLPRAHSVGTWLALEDIHPDSGPLEVFPQSHRESLWDEYELGLPCAAKAIDAAIASNDEWHGPAFLRARHHAAVRQSPQYSKVDFQGVQGKQPSSCGGASCEYFSVMERLFANRTLDIPSLKRGQMLLWAASLVHASQPARNASLTRSSFIAHYMWNTSAYWVPASSKRDIKYVPKRVMQIPITMPGRKSSSTPRHAASGHAASGHAASGHAASGHAAPAPAPAHGRSHASDSITTRNRELRSSAAPTLKADIGALDREAAPPDAPEIVLENRAAHRSVFVVGASRGVGLALVKVYAASGYTVHASTRTLSEPGELGKVPGVQLHQLDVLSASDIAALRVKADTGALGAIGTVVHNAAVKNQNLTHSMLVNSQAPFDVAGALLPAVLRSEARKLCIITSDMASEEVMRHQKSTRQKWPYTISKKAANKRFKEIEPSWRAQGITAIVMNPGYVKTGMSGGFGDLTPLQSAGSIKRTIENTTHADAGKFFDYDGKILPW